MKRLPAASVCLLLACGGCDLLFQIQKVKPTDAGGDAPPSTTDGFSYPVDGLVASYTFDETDPYRDVTGHGHDAYCVTCPALVPGQRGSAISFDGTQRVGAPSLELSQITVAFWFDAIPIAQQGCPINKVLGTVNDNSWQICFDPASASNTVVEIYSAPSVALFKTLLISPGWHHAAFSFDGIHRAVAIDAAIVASDLMGAVTNDSGAISIGTDIDGGQPASQFIGKLDEIKIFDHALTEKDIATVAATP